MITKITITWSIEDIEDAANNMDCSLTKKQQSDVLQQIKNGHDATIGINWDVIQQAIIDYCDSAKIPYSDLD